MNKIIKGDCIEEMKKLPDNSVDAIVTDPPYGLEFMGKEWDKFKHGNTIINPQRTFEHKKGFKKMVRFAKDYETMIKMQSFSTEWATECLRVLKAGGFLLAFGGTRTYHRLACGIEDAGFEIRDMISYLYGSGFPKSLNIRKNMEKQIDRFINSIDYDLIWKTQMIKNVFNVEKKLKKNQTEVETNIQKKDFVLKNALENIQKEGELLNVRIVENLSSEVKAISKNTFIVLQNVEQNTQTSKQNVKFVVKKLLNEEARLNQINIFIVECNVKELLKERIMDKIKEEEVLKIWLGKLLSSKKQDLNALCVELIENLKHIILNQLKISQNLDIKYLMDNVPATNVIITKSIMECLISFMGDILKEKINDYKGEGTALKPAQELICVARKPLSEKNVALNVLKWGTGGINIDGCRIESPNADLNRKSRANKIPLGRISQVKETTMESITNENQGRFPTNIILECTCDETKQGQEEVIQNIDFKEDKQSDMGWGTKKCITKPQQQNYKIHTNPNCPCYMLDEQSGESKSTIDNSKHKDKKGKSWFTGNQIERTQRGDSGGASRFFYCAKASKSERNFGMEEKQTVEQYEDGKPVRWNKGGVWTNDTTPAKNNHPTVKPIALMEYLIKLVSKEGATILDPFVGSGTTLIACAKLNRVGIGIEKEEEYIKIAKARLKPFLEQRKLK